MAKKVSEDGPSVWIKRGDAILTGEVKIVSVEDISGVPFKSGWSPEVGLKVMFQVEGYDKPNTLLIFSKYKRNEADEIIGHMYRSNVVSFLVRVLGTKDVDVNDDWSINLNVLPQCVGKTMTVLKYGKGIYEGGDKPTVDWQHWDKIGTNGEELAKEFQESVDRGWPSDYDPNAFDLLKAIKDKDATSFNHGANVESSDEEPPV